MEVEIILDRFAPVRQSERRKVGATGESERSEFT